LAGNAGLAVLNAGISIAIIVPLTIWVAGALGGLSVDWRPVWWGGWAGLALDMVLLDLWIYWWHRFNHVVPLLWRFHQVHHLDRTLDVTTAVRFHFGEVVLSALARVPVVVILGFPVTSVLAFEAALGAASAFHHSNLKLPRALERALSRVIITPSIHWVHHHRVRRDTDSNYGTIFSFWDRLFGSRSRTARTSDMEIGVEGRPERDFARLLWVPFGKG
ncbi:MAG: sterol desaturase family protein, partial [Haliea sp.]